MEGVERQSIAGEIPNPINPPAGCHFNPRCPYVMPHCKTIVPPLYHVGRAKVLCHLYAEDGVNAAQPLPAP
jgi:oligopeptide/dipeptide ABC transporter ATP-binding protein